ncbi:hypothetical protein T440DRAFT_39786 [Plenodomus tracheiphilus IPT5]|uniref:Uncharacterized protein n=1 Tax=Plenodomus tracheiphilus IPT5 TaxID=1408161 RepID=A0A6A7BA76_9PLEO|nr:hypothetical protein T440DRAFT_39786 [Plenodomus tracheiphilus IPT5]
MVLRLFVPPGEGQDLLIPRRPDPIGANATLQYTVLASTGLAAAYTSLAASHHRRVRPHIPITRTALFIQSSARFGIWVGALGAAANWYYYSAFATVAASKVVPDLRPWKLYEQTKSLTIEDGCLAGAALGAAVAMPTLFMRRPAIPRWTRCFGTTHIGASTGILGAHGYLQYTGERQEAYRCLERCTKRKNLELWAIFWDKELMAQFNPIVQQYIRNNSIWHASLLPESAFQQQPDDRGLSVPESPGITPSQEAPLATEAHINYYVQPSDYAEELRTMDVPATIAEVERLELQKANLLAEAEYMVATNATKQWKYCHNDQMNEEDRRARLQEMFVLEMTHNRLLRLAHDIDEKLVRFRLALQHRAVWSEFTDSEDAMAKWIPKLHHCVESQTFVPGEAISGLEELHRMVGAEVKRFEEMSTDARFQQASREQCKKDAEDGRCLLQAVDRVIFGLGVHSKKAGEAEASAGREVEGKRQGRDQGVGEEGGEGVVKMLEREGMSTAVTGVTADGKELQTPVVPETKSRSSGDGQSRDGV